MTLPLFRQRVTLTCQRQTRTIDPATRDYICEDEELTGVELDRGHTYALVRFDGAPEFGSARGLELLVALGEL